VLSISIKIDLNYRLEIDIERPLHYAHVFVTHHHRRYYIEARGGSCLLLIFSFPCCLELKKSNKIIKIVATSCQILKIKYTKFNFGWGSAPDPLGELTNPVVGFKGTYF